MKYSTASDQLSGSYQVKFGEQSLDCQMKPTRTRRTSRPSNSARSSCPPEKWRSSFSLCKSPPATPYNSSKSISIPPTQAKSTPKTDVQTNDAAQNAAKPEPKRIKQSNDGSIVLPARDVVVHGTTVRYEPDKNTIGYWLKKEDWVSWDLEVVTPGTFSLEMLEGCGAGSGGSHYTVEIAGQKLQDKVQDTGSFHDFRLRKVGEVKIDKPGNYTLSVRVDDKPGHAVMDLRLVTLTPPKPKKENSAKPETPK